MNPYLSMKRLSFLFLVVFGVAMVGVFVFQRYWADPGERCEARGDWYDISTRTCARPVYIPDITGRPAGVSRAEASAAKNRELVELERRAAQIERAGDAATEAERARVQALQAD
jgi:hypothetical protein